MGNCKHCGKTLNRSQYNINKTYKSCPRCSELNGEEHIFFPYPDYFGDTLKRSSSNHPEGPQSHCYVHRGNPYQSIPYGGVCCSEIK